MNVPAVVASELGEESVVSRVSLKGDDAVFLTPTRTLVYSAEGLFSDESVASYSLDAERVALSEGRRKATLTLDYGLDGTEEFSVPAASVDDVLEAVLAGVLHATGVLEADQTVEDSYRFSELTLVVVSDRLLKHVGGDVWDADYEAVPFETVRDVTVEEGSVASQLVLTTEGRTERIKAPAERFRAVREAIERALFDYHDVGSYEAFRQAVGADEDEGEGEDEADEPAESAEPDEDAPTVDDAEASSGATLRESGVDPIGMADDETADESGDSEADAENAGVQTPRSGVTVKRRANQSASETPPDPTAEESLDREALETELETLREAVERQADLLEEQRERIDDLLELTRDR
ncbi:MAG: hypothetical protein ABEI57_05725 [Halapricum sp.]